MGGRGRTGGERSRTDGGGGSERERQFAQHWELLLFRFAKVFQGANIVCYVGPVGRQVHA
jgi:hypothetical protein